MADPTPERQDLRERIAKALIARIKQSVIIDWAKQPGTVGQPLAATEYDLADAALAVLVEPPGDLREQMAAAIRHHHNAGDIRSEDWSVAGDVCACGVMVTDWVGHLAEVMAPVCREDAARRIAAAEARADEAERGRDGERRRAEAAEAAWARSDRYARRFRLAWQSARQRAKRYGEIVSCYGRELEENLARAGRAEFDRDHWQGRARVAEAQVAALQNERDLLREALGESDLGAQVLAQWEAIAAADADRDRLEAQVAALQRSIQHLAAEAHRRKWVWEGTSPGAFEELHRIGNELLAALPSRPDDPEEIRRLAESTER